MRTLLSRVRAHQDGQPDKGAAMVVVLGIMLVGAIITATLAMVTVYNTRSTLENREEMRALQSADAGLDLMLSLFEGKKYNELNGICSRSFVINNDTVEVVTDYRVKRGANTINVACPTATDITLSVTVTSTATTEATGLGDAQTRTVAAVFAPNPPTTTLDKAIFSEGSVTLTNNMEILASGAVDGSGQPIFDANVYSNGYVDCKTQSDVGGSIYAAQSYVLLANQCGVKNTVWAKDYVQMSSGVTVAGDVYAASQTSLSYDGLPHGILLQNSGARITGAALTNTSIWLQDGARIGESAYSGTGRIKLQNGGTLIGGSAYAKTGIVFSSGGTIARNAYVTGGGISVSNSGTVTGNVQISGTVSGPLTRGGTLTANAPVPAQTTLLPHPDLPSALGFPSTLQPPPREQMPRMSLMNTADQAKWTDAGWKIYRPSGSDCSGTSLVTYLNNISGQQALVIFDGCTSTPTIDNATLTLRTDMALVIPRGFTSNNNLTVKSNDSSQTRKFYLITPSDSAGVTWNAAAAGQTTPVCSSPAGNISINKAQQIQSIEWLIYSPCAVTWSNGIQNGGGRFVGQIYGKSVTLLSNFPMTMRNMPVPSLTSSDPSLTSPAKVSMSSRFDVRS